MSGSIWRMVKPSAVDVDGPRELFSEPEFGRGTFAGGGESTCPGCGAPVPRSQRAQPAVVQWRTWDPLRFGDFTWPSGTFPLIGADLARDLRKRFSGFEPGPVAPRERLLRRDEKEGRRLPDRFLERARGLRELWVVKRCRPDPERSTIRTVRPRCSVCGLVRCFWGEDPDLVRIFSKGVGGLRVLEGVEYWSSGVWDDAAERIPKLKHPRQPGRGLFFGAAEIGDAGVFCIEGSSAVLCTGEFRDFVERRGCTNVAFMEAGELIA